MINEVFKTEIIIDIIAIICIVGLILKVMVALCYRHLIKEADDMSRSKNRFLKNTKTKFSTEYENSFTISNVSLFVDKYMYEMKILRIRTSTWEGIGTFILIVCLLLGSSGALWSFQNGSEDRIVEYILTAAVSAGVLVLADSLINAQRRREQLHVNMCYFLENHLKPQLENGCFDFDVNSLSRLSDEIDEGMMELINSMNQSKDEENSAKKSKRKDNKYNQTINISKGEQKIVEDVIKEYLT